ncbi:penicillin-binding protein [Flavobacterium sp. 316]|uniref:serine hydrolase n=1 Tax=Flavobacterium sp. 316 TaxID=1603293 RepID=UPI0005E61F14|nr:serine hydrolase [Flavobacterium sp. 316]KIX19814.1 penicillin-binding protein [Flavobacterium sp. 316]
MSRKYFSLLFLFISISIFSQTKLNEKNLDKQLLKLQETTQTVGFSVAIVKDNQVIYSKGFGYRDAEQKLKANENTLYPIGSTSKAFTTALLGIMEEEKGLKFTDSPIKYLPELKFYNDELNNKITILDMISHRTGLPRHDFSWYLFPIENKDSLLSRVKYHEPFTGIREKWHYNNFMYLAQGLITEKLTGKSWEDNIRERFFKPLNMSTSNLSIEELKKQSNISKGYSLENFETNEAIPYYDIAAISPAGSINSSVKEMANWLKIWLNEGKLNEVQVLPKRYVEKAINPLMLVGNGIADKQFPNQHLNSYGYAWFVSSYKGHYRVEHGGNIDGFSANVSFFPTDKIGIVVLTNQDGSALPTLVRNAISDEVLNLEKTDWVAYYDKLIAPLKKQIKDKKEKEAESKVNHTTPTHNITEYTGKYNHKGYGTFQIEVKNDSLWANFTREKVYLKHTHYDVFKGFALKGNKVSSDEVGSNFNFQTNDLGDIESVKLNIETTLDPIIFKRSPLEVAVSTEKLNKYVGSYLLSGVELKISIKNDNLKLFVPGQPEYTLIPIKENEFSIKGLSGYKAVFEEKDNKLNVVLHQPNGVFTAVKQ